MFPQSLLRFFYSYLSERKQYVMYNGFRSQDFGASSGVPRGSVLGPLLFTIFVNDLPARLKVGGVAFADDLKIYTEIRSNEDCQNLQGELMMMHQWCLENKLHLTVSKCKYMSILERIHCFRTSSDMRLYRFLCATSDGGRVDVRRYLK
ncbi:hypothetical protein HHI36_004340 [Cryptolaemus montrouzieri]|uniref:Reverse transcriptase domain-containing protein n=1 Tax=Cryptolaemus montrouzieri TaxID=559131 RepID=A0ABD2NQW6_9CUCU